jgi:hypothetical protein
MRLFKRKPKFDWSPTQKRVKARMNEILDMTIEDFGKFLGSDKLTLLDIIAFQELERKHKITKLEEIK